MAKINKTKNNSANSKRKSAKHNGQHPFHNKNEMPKQVKKSKKKPTYAYTSDQVQEALNAMVEIDDLEELGCLSLKRLPEMDSTRCDLHPEFVDYMCAAHNVHKLQIWSMKNRKRVQSPSSDDDGEDEVDSTSEYVEMGRSKTMYDCCPVANRENYLHMYD
ncbi:hypothetical protein QAD02_007770 [Eretmocerus hayati]|uniref:Uncharacterized protein n=1 Tax=Eretmocerus hayati TaxID=131215 RepID=A0ACC2N5V8_9HYME|nr:hypothetical protein QAD02_007770 [Eretmocerus hayati]